MLNFKEFSDILLPAIKTKDKVYVGKIRDNHYDLIDSVHLHSSEDREYGYVDKDENFLTRQEALEYVKVYSPDIYKAYMKAVRRSSFREPSYNQDKGLESVGYLKALGFID